MAARTDRARKKAPRQPSAPDLPAELTSATLADHDLADGGVYELLAFADLDLSGREVTGAEIDACRYGNVNLSQARLRRTLVRDVAFDRCDLANLRALDCSFTRVAVTGEPDDRPVLA